MNEQEFTKIYINILNSQEETNLKKRQDYIVSQIKLLAKINNMSFNGALAQTYEVFLNQFLKEEDENAEAVLQRIVSDIQMIKSLNMNKNSMKHLGEAHQC